MKIYVVGSGPAGVAAARALTTAGHQITVLDAGAELESDRRQMIDDLSRRDVEDWSGESVAAIKSGMRSGSSGAVRKLVYGSDFPYRDAMRVTPIVSDGATAISSLAKGGLSNVWGAAVLPYRAEDIEDWPVPAAELAPAYRSLFRFMPLSARRDDLERLFPLYTDAFKPLALSEQAEQLLSRMDRNKSKLAGAGFVCGASRLAVHHHATGCVYCGLCMYGCPHRLIYQSAQSLENVEYVSNVLIERVTESGQKVTLHARDLADDSELLFEADRVFIACGVFQTARILLRSLEAGDRPLTLHDSQYFLLPCLGSSRARDAPVERLHTLSQVFIEVSEPSVSDHSVHLQVYTYNDLYASAMSDRLGRLYPFIKSLSASVLNRLMVIQGYLHSGASSTASVALENGTLAVRGHDNRVAASRVRRLVRKLMRHAPQLGFVPLMPFLEIGDVGRGSHVGATLPMRNRPGPFETDRYGRPHGFSRVHVVDASVLPSIPATTITLSVMANAHRIAGMAYDN